MILDTGLTGIDIVKAAGGLIGTFIIIYVMWAIKILMGRLKAIENEQTEQKVKNQSFMDHDIHAEKDNKEFKAAVVSIGDKIDNLKTSNVNMKESFESKFVALTASIHKLELKIVSDKNGK